MIISQSGEATDSVQGADQPPAPAHTKVHGNLEHTSGPGCCRKEDGTYEETGGPDDDSAALYSARTV